MEERRQGIIGLEEKLDKIIRVVTRTEVQVEALMKGTEVQVEALMKADADNRITSIETGMKWMKGVIIAVPSFGALIFGAIRLYKLF
jgi:hypothetical protein